MLVLVFLSPRGVITPPIFITPVVTTAIASASIAIAVALIIVILVLIIAVLIPIPVAGKVIVIG